MLGRRLKRRAREELTIRILIVEDDDALAERLGRSLKQAGFIVERAADGDDGYMMGMDGGYDAMIVDLGLPGRQGMDVIKDWREAGVTTPVLILTARSGWSEKVEGLNRGADDYLTKPFHTPELIARLRALTRRASGVATPSLVHGDLTLNTATNEVMRGSEPVELTAFEFRMLKYFMHRVGHIIPQGELIEHLYPLNDTRESNTIEVYVGRLRRKIGADKIKTVRGLGYRFG